MSKTTKTTTTKTTKAPTVPLLVHAMAKHTQDSDYLFNEWPTILKLLPEFLAAAVEGRSEDWGAPNAYAIASRVVNEGVADSPDYAKPRHEAFMAALHKFEIPNSAGKLWADEYLDELQHEYTRAGLLIGIAYAHAFMVEAGILGKGGAR